MSEANDELFRTMVDKVWNEKAPGAIEKYVSENYVGHYPDGDVRGLEGFRDLFETFRVAFPDSHITIQQLLSDGDTLSAAYVYEATHEGEFEGIAPTGNSVSVNGVGIYRIEDGELAEDRVMWDTLSLMQQIGAA